jgi:hypothetical protein
VDGVQRRDLAQRIEHVRAADVAREYDSVDAAERWRDPRVDVAVGVGDHAD